jgi:hypothetical protein
MIYFYVYYTISPKKFSEAQHAITLLIESVYTSIGITPQILKRADDPYTWMEVYIFADPHTPIPQLTAILDNAAEKSGLLSCLSRPRATECFIRAM